MKALKLKYNLTILLVLLGAISLSISASAQILTENKRVIKSFALKNNATVEVSNKYGKVHVVTWEKDSVRFDIKMKITSNDQMKIDKVISETDFDFVANDYYIIAKTTFKTKYGGFLKDIKDFAENITPTSNTIEIDYKVYIPAEANLKVDNKYGDVFTTDLTGDVTIKISNGDFKANNLTGRVEMDLSFCDAVINEMNDGRIITNYSELYIDKAKRLTLESKSSKITLDKLDYLKTISRRDKYYVKKIESVHCTSSFTDYWFTDLSKEITANVKYGQMNLEKINKGFSYLNINSNYTDLNLTFEKESSYDLSITHKEIELSYPLNLGELTKTMTKEDPKKFVSTGQIGSGTTTAKVKINAESGILTIIHL